MTVVPSPVDSTWGQAGISETPKFLGRLMRRPVAIVCVGYVAALIAVAVVAPIAMPWVANQHAGDLLATRQGPSSHHLLGTDTLGRDVLERILVGTRVSLLGVGEALAVVLVLGVPFGLVAGYHGGWLDRIVTWLGDLTFSIPAIVMIMVVLAVFPESMLAGMCTLGVVAAPGLMRVVRAATLQVRDELYIGAARVSGLSHVQIIRRHVLSRIAGPIIVQASLLAALALLVQSYLAFLGLVVAAPAPSWGGMVADGVNALELQSWLIWPPGIVLAVTILAFGLLGDAARDATTERWSPTPSRSDTSRRRYRRKPVRPADDSDQQRRPSRRTRDETDRSTDTRGALLTVDGLTASFGTRAGRATVLADVSFAIDEGEAVGLVGESGCGKTATAMAILGLLPASGTVDSGKIIFDGRDLTSLSARGMGRIRGGEIALVSQEPMVGLNPAFRVGWQLAECVRRHLHLPRTEAKAAAIELLRLVRLPNPESVARRYPHELSGGMAQRVAIARALAGNPKLLIADEPTTALDVTVQAEILNLLRELRRDRQMALLLVTHDWGVVADVCDRALVMYAGEIVERARVERMFRAPLHPYTEALFASNPYLANHADELPMIPGAVPLPGMWPIGCHFHPRCRYAIDQCRTGAIALARPEPDHETRCTEYKRLAGAAR
jgi:peptide/nickel transport system permease protein